MKKMIQRSICLLLCLMMCISMLSTSVSAEVAMREILGSPDKTILSGDTYHISTDVDSIDFMTNDNVSEEEIEKSDDVYDDQSDSKRDCIDVSTDERVPVVETDSELYPKRIDANEPLDTPENDEEKITGTEFVNSEIHTVDPADEPWQNTQEKADSVPNDEVVTLFSVPVSGTASIENRPGTAQNLPLD